MKKMHIMIIVISVVSVVVILSLIFTLGMRTYISGGDIGIIEIENFIATSKLSVKDLKDFKDNPSIKAVVIRVDSPGGIVAASQEIYDEVKEVKEKKKVIVSMGAVAASGAYYISLPADVIVANPGTITGSIGVIMEFPVIEELLKKLGIRFEAIKSKEHKDIGSPFRPMSEKERKLLQGVISDIYEQFIDAVAKDRNLPKDSVLKFADGRIFSGRQAKEFGFVDTLGSFEDAVKIAGDLVGIEKPHLVYPPQRLSFIDFFTKPMESLLSPRISYLWQ